jgi:hypothetical protein
MSIEDVREFLREAERLEYEATENRKQADALVRAGDLCPSARAGWKQGRCCGDPDACAGRRYP